MKSFFSLLALALGSRWSESTVLLQKNEKRAEWNDLPTDSKMTLGFEREWWVGVSKGGTRIEFEDDFKDHTTVWETDVVRFDFELQGGSDDDHGAPEAITKDYGFDIGTADGQALCNVALKDMGKIMDEMDRERKSTKFDRPCSYDSYLENGGVKRGASKCPSRSISTTFKKLTRVEITDEGDEATFVFPPRGKVMQLSPQVTVTLALPALEHLWKKGWPMESYNPAHPKVQAEWRTAVMKDTAHDAFTLVDMLGSNANGHMATPEADFLKGFMVIMVQYAKVAAIKYNGGEYWSNHAKKWFYIHSHGEQWTKDNYGVLGKTPPAHLFNELPEHPAAYYEGEERIGSLKADNVAYLKNGLYDITINDLVNAQKAAGRLKKFDGRLSKSDLEDMDTREKVRGMSLEDAYDTVAEQRGAAKTIAKSSDFIKTCGGIDYSNGQFMDNAFDHTVTDVSAGTPSGCMWNVAIGDGGSANIVYRNRAAFEFRQMNEEHNGRGDQNMAKAIRDLSGLGINTIPNYK